MTEPDKSKNDSNLDNSIPGGTVSLGSILHTEELRFRPQRPPDYEKENQALVALASALADPQCNVLQTLSETILEVTQCDSAGVSLLTKEDGGKRFYWPAIAGAWKPHVGGGTPRDFGPCGDVLDRNCTLLFQHFERRYPYLLPVTPAAEECLMVPFYVGGKAVGTIWAITHNDRRRFDAEDERILNALGQFASLAYQTLESINDLKFQIVTREKAETAVRELASDLEIRIRCLVDANIIGIFTWNLEGKIVEANDGFLHLLEYYRDDLVSGSMRWTDLTPPEWRYRDEHAVTLLKAHGSVQPYEKEFFRKNGGRVPVLVGGALFESGGNEGVAFVLDLSERKRAEEALRRSEALLSEAQKLSRTGSWRWNVRTMEVVWSQEYYAIFGFDQEKDKASYNSAVERIHPEDRSAVEEIRAAAVREKRDFEAEYRLLLPGGLIKYLHTMGHYMASQSGDIEFLGTVMDITEGKKEEFARRYSEEKHRVVVETANDAVVSMDETSTILFANHATMKVFGYEPKELIGKPLTTLMPEFMRKLHEEGFRRYLATGERHINWKGTELTGLHKNGQAFPIEVSFGELTKGEQRIFTGFIRDITERKQAEEALRRSEAYLAEAQSLSHSGSWHWNVHTGEVNWSQEYCRIFGFDFEKDKPSYDLFIERVHPEDRAKVEQVLFADVREKRDFHGEYRLLLPNSVIKFVRSIGRCKASQCGDVEYIGAVIDITEHKRAEEALRRSESYLAEAQRLSHTGSFGWDVSSGEIYWSAETFRIFEYQPTSKVTIEMVLQRTHPEDRSAMQQLIERVSREKKEWNFEHRLLMPDGSIKYLQVVGRPSADEGGHFEFVGAVTDVSERKQAEAAIRATDQQLAAQGAQLHELFEQAPEGVVLLDVEDRVLRINREFIRIFGYAPDEAIGRSINELIASGELRSEAQEYSHRVTELGETLNVETVRTRKDGSRFPVSIIGVPVSIAGSQIAEYAIYRDITERRRADEERERLHRAQADLAHINRVTTMGELTASLAHEIKQPISAAMTNAQTCLRWLAHAQPDIAEARQAASRLVKDVSRASDVVSRVGLLFKKNVPQRELTDINEVIQEMIALLRGEAARCSISIRSDLANDLPSVIADRVGLQQVLMNLMLNGIEAMKDMGKPGTLTIIARPFEKHQLLVSVCDTGAGLKPEQTEQIFKAFFTSKPQGTGMGLPISRSIIESHGGRLWATSNAGLGATFQFTLPVEASTRQTT